MEIDLVSELLPSGGFEGKVTAMGMFSRWFFAIPTSNQDAKTFPKVILNTMTNLAYLLTILISDERSTIVSQVNKEAINTRANKWGAWTISRVNETSVEDWNRRPTIIVA